MSNPKFYIEGNKWFYENVRPSYKELKNSYSASQRANYNNIGAAYRVNQQSPHLYSVKSYFVPSMVKTFYTQQNLSYKSDIYK